MPLQKPLVSIEAQYAFGYRTDIRKGNDSGEIRRIQKEMLPLMVQTGVVEAAEAVAVQR